MDPWLKCILIVSIFEFNFLNQWLSCRLKGKMRYLHIRAYSKLHTYETNYITEILMQVL